MNLLQRKLSWNWIFLGLLSAMLWQEVSAYQLGMLGSAPDWSELDLYQDSMSRSEFVQALETVYLPYGIDKQFIRIQEDHALILKNVDQPRDYYRLRFADSATNQNENRPVANDWPLPRSKRFQDLVIALDPGHIGGIYSEMEERHFQIGEDPPVKEGDLTLLVARKLKSALEELGAEVHMLRTESEPVTQNRPEDYLAEAERVEREKWLESNKEPGARPPLNAESFQKKIRSRANLLFYRVSEIQARASLINKEIKPDFTLAIHFNVTAWPDSSRQTLASDDHMHVIVHGTYTPNELALDDIRLHLFQNLLSRNHLSEIPLCASVAGGLAFSTGLPAFRYRGRHASNQAENPYLWARNLLANRLYRGPVVYLEVYCTNSKRSYQRIQLGDYEGLKQVGDSEVQSLFDEYVEGVVTGLVDYFSPEE